MFGKKQKGFTIIELVITMFIIAVFLGAVSLLGAAVYAVGKFLFGWWG